MTSPTSDTLPYILASETNILLRILNLTRSDQLTTFMCGIRDRLDSLGSHHIR